jgi:uncharacterized membrane protein YqaE (UPF0057 family)
MTDGNLQTKSMYDKFMYGGMGYGLFCVPKELPKYIIMIIFPPLSVFIEEMNGGFKNVGKIIINFILTSFFYFPGLLHAMSVIRCGALGSDKDKDPRCTSGLGAANNISNLVNNKNNSA